MNAKNDKNTGLPDEKNVRNERPNTVLDSNQSNRPMRATLERLFSELRPNTVRRYRTVLRDFETFLGGDLSEITEQDVFEYWDSLRDGDRNYSGQTLASYINALSSMFEYLRRRGKVSINPFDRAAIRIPHKDWNRKRKAECVPFEQVLPFCNAPDRKSRDGIRDRAFLALLFGGALRISEARALKCGDVRALTLRGSGVVIYLTLAHTKAGKAQEQALPHWAAERVLRLLEIRHSQRGGPDDPFLTGYRTEYDLPNNLFIAMRTLARIFSKYRDSLKLPKSITPHSARVTAISRLIDRGIPIREVQSFARHASVTTTENYIRLEQSLENCPARELNYC